MELNNCILLITHNRENFVKRWLRFYYSVECKIPIIVAASGNKKSLAKIKELESQNKILDLSVSYFDDSDNLFLKVVKTLQSINYDVVSICADDDYILPAACINASKFLMDNKQFVSVSGYCFSIGRRYLFEEKCFEDKHFIVPDNQIPVSMDSPLDRLKYHFQNYTPTFYSTFRKKDLIQLFHEGYQASNNKIDNLFQNELFMSGLTIAKGKTHVLKELYLIRQGGNPISSSSSGFIPLDVYIRTQDVDTFTNYFRERFNKISNSTYKKKQIAEAIINYCVKFMRPTFKEVLFLRYYEKYKYKFYFNLALIQIIILGLIHKEIDKRSIIYCFKAYKSFLINGNSPETENYYEEHLINKFKEEKELVVISDLICKYPLGIDELCMEVS